VRQELPPDAVVQHIRNPAQNLALVQTPPAGVISPSGHTGNNGSILAHNWSDTTHGNCSPFRTTVINNLEINLFHDPFCYQF